MERRKEGPRPRCPYLVLDPLDAVEDDGAVASLDVVQAVHGGVHGGATEHGDLDERAGPRRGCRDPAAALDVHPRPRERLETEPEEVVEHLGGRRRRRGAAARVLRGVWFGERNGRRGLVEGGG